MRRASVLVWVAVAMVVGGCGHRAAVGTGAPPAGGSALLAEVRGELQAMRATRYQHTTEVDAAKGAFFYDCSGFVDYALGRSAPAALSALPITTSAGRPLAQDFEHHLRSADGPWRPVATVPELLPGDVITWLATPDSKTRDTGHVMVVPRAPEHNPDRPDEWLVRVADSTVSPHSGDSRRAGEQGLGTGMVGLSSDGSGRPVGFYWRGGVSKAVKLTDIALGRLEVAAR